MPDSLQKIAEGFTAEIFRLDADRVLNLHKPPFASVRDAEFEKMRLLADCADFIPPVYETVTVDNRPGYTMPFIDGPSLRTLSQNIADPNEIADPMFTLYLRLLNINTPSSFESVSDRIAARITHHQKDEKMRTATLQLLSTLPPGSHLCHGDFHAGNILISDSASYLIDWNGSARSDLHADLAKTLILTRYAPPSLALQGNGYDQRAEICCAYLTHFSHQNLLDESLLTQWLLIRAVEFQTFNIPSFQQSLYLHIQTWLTDTPPNHHQILSLDPH